MSLLQAGVPPGSPQRGVGLSSSCQNPRYHDRFGDCCCLWCLLGDFTAGKDSCGACAIGSGALIREVTGGDRCMYEAGSTNPIAEAASGLSPLPQGAPSTSSKQVAKES